MIFIVWDSYDVYTLITISHWLGTSSKGQEFPNIYELHCRQQTKLWWLKKQKQETSRKEVQVSTSVHRSDKGKGLWIGYMYVRHFM